MDKLFTRKNLIFCISFGFLVMSFYCFYLLMPTITNYTTYSQLQDNFFAIKGTPFFYENYQTYFTQDFQSFNESIQKNFVYTEKFDCKYWSYIWSRWILENREKYNIELQYITTPNHIFVMAYNEKGYCIMDGANVNCFRLKLK